MSFALCFLASMLGGCRNNARATSATATRQMPPPPKCEPRLSGVSGEGVPLPPMVTTFDEGAEILRAIGPHSSTRLPPPVHRVIRSGDAAQPIRSYDIPSAWQELVKGFLITTPEKVGGQWHHATHLRAVRSSSGELIGINLFETPSHHLPFATVGSGASEHFTLIELAVGEAQSATVQWEGDQPVAISLYR
jgi:hypothetical protein